MTTKVNKIDVRKVRAMLLANFGRYAEQVLTEKSGLQSMLLCCSQFYADEAGDAVHESIRCSDQLLPIEEKERRDDYSLRSKWLRWDSNGEAIVAFSAHCSEEGASAYATPPGDDEDEEGYWEGGAPSESTAAFSSPGLGFRTGRGWAPSDDWLHFGLGASADLT